MSVSSDGTGWLEGLLCFAGNEGLGRLCRWTKVFCTREDLGFLMQVHDPFLLAMCCQGCDDVSSLGQDRASGDGGVLRGKGGTRVRNNHWSGTWSGIEDQLRWDGE